MKSPQREPVKSTDEGELLQRHQYQNYTQNRTEISLAMMIFYCLYERRKIMRNFTYLPPLLLTRRSTTKANVRVRAYVATDSQGFVFPPNCKDRHTRYLRPIYVLS